MCMALIELNEREFLQVLYSRIKKAKVVGDVMTMGEHKRLLEQYKIYKSEKMLMRYYIDDSGGLYLVPYTKEEHNTILKKYRECGIW